MDYMEQKVHGENYKTLLTSIKEHIKKMDRYMINKCWKSKYGIDVNSNENPNRYFCGTCHAILNFVGSVKGQIARHT